MDSSGHCAQYCSYTMMDNTTKQIVSLVTMDKTHIAGKSANLEKACFIKSMTALTQKRVRISEVVTDSHVQITALMSKFILCLTVCSIVAQLPARPYYTM